MLYDIEVTGMVLPSDGLCSECWKFRECFLTAAVTRYSVVVHTMELNYDDDDGEDEVEVAESQG